MTERLQTPADRLPLDDTPLEDVTYDDGIVRLFIAASVGWGVVGLLAGVFIASQMAFHQLNFHEYFTFGRLRPLHTNAVIFAFVGNMIFAGIYYSTQRLLKARMASDLLSKVHFYGWQLIIVAAAVTLPLGMTQSKEYAELEWPIDIAVTLVWVIFAINFFWTLRKRREQHLYVAIWFYIATIVTVAVLYIVNNLALPVFGSTIKSYSMYAGVQDALVQWWYGHNAVAFFLTTPVLGIMYYFLPKAAGRPVYSYRLSIVHFWALIFLYIWAGPHHLLYTALPEWAQSMGMVFSVMLWAPSWGGMLNGLLTLRGAWDKLRTDPVIKFLIAGVTFYGMATFEGPLLSIKSVSALGHYTDWIIGHVHSGALGWNGFMAAGMFYWLVPKLFGTKLHSKSMANTHFWLGTLGILLYALAMWVSGIKQGLMWKAVTPEGALMYPNFVETTIAIWWMYLMRIVGGGLYLVGFLCMAYNLFVTARSGRAVTVTIKAPRPVFDHAMSARGIMSSPAMVLALAAVVMTVAFFAVSFIGSIVIGMVIGMLALLGWGLVRYQEKTPGDGLHRVLEGRPMLFTVLTILAILIGGVVELVPTLLVDAAVPVKGDMATPYTPLELHGRDIYVREGCYNCHSQMIRPFRSEELRYGKVSQAGEFQYDRPFQWGSKRTGPDLHRVGGKYPNLWHYQHMMDPRSTSEGSTMPSYAFMADNKIDVGDTVIKVTAMKTLGTPYTANEVANSAGLAQQQAEAIANDLAASGVTVAWDTEMVALIAYMQRLGKHPAHPSQKVAPPKEQEGAK